MLNISELVLAEITAGVLVRCGARTGNDDLIDLTELIVGRIAHRLVERIADTECGGDNQGAEHQADDDEYGLGRTPGNVAHADAEDDRPAQEDVKDCQKADGQKHDHDGRDTGHRNAE